MAITAADDCTQNVNTPPNSRNTSVVTKLVGSNEAKKSSTVWFSPRCISPPVILSVPRPSSRNDSPNRKSPIYLYFFR